ncbi:hypothetical protein Tco_1506372 [Tanacetum coccineum]
MNRNGDNKGNLEHETRVDPAIKINRPDVGDANGQVAQKSAIGRRIDSTLEHGWPANTNKRAILGDVIRVLNQLEPESQESKKMNEKLLEEIKTLKINQPDVGDANGQVAQKSAIGRRIDSTLEHGWPANTNKRAILGDVIRVLNQLEPESQESKKMNEKLLEEIKTLKVSLSTAGKVTLHTFAYKNKQGHRSAIRISNIVSETLRIKGMENVTEKSFEIAKSPVDNGFIRVYNHNTMDGKGVCEGDKGLVLFEHFIVSNEVMSLLLRSLNQIRKSRGKWLLRLFVKTKVAPQRVALLDSFL